MSETLLHFQATGMRNGPNDYSLIKNNNNTNSLYFPGAPTSPPWSISLDQFLRKRLDDNIFTLTGMSTRSSVSPPLSASHPKPHPPSTRSAQWPGRFKVTQKQGSGEWRWNALLIYSPRRRSRAAEVLLQQIYSKWGRSASRWSCSNLTALLAGTEHHCSTPLCFSRGSWQLFKWSFTSFLHWVDLAPVRDDCTGSLCCLILLVMFLKTFNKPPEPLSSSTDQAGWSQRSSLG